MSNDIALFIDNGYLQKVLHDSYDQSRIDYLKLAELMRGNDNLICTYFYDCECYVSKTPTYTEMRRRISQQTFFNFLKSLPRFKCRIGTLKRVFDQYGEPHFIQKEVDVWLGVDLVDLSFNHQITKAKIIAGDVDFVPAIKRAEKHGVITELFYSPSSVNSKLLNTVDTATVMTADLIKKATRMI